MRHKEFTWFSAWFKCTDKERETFTIELRLMEVFFLAICSCPTMHQEFSIYNTI